jgi:HSP20 family molecular chaperone IbpA
LKKEEETIDKLRARLQELEKLKNQTVSDSYTERNQSSNGKQHSDGKTTSNGTFAASTMSAKLKDISYDIWENETKLVVVVDTPSIATKNVDISIGYQTLTILRRIGVFEKNNLATKFKPLTLNRLDKELFEEIKDEIPLPVPVDVTQKNVYSENGTLYITLNKAVDDDDDDLDGIDLDGKEELF